MIDILRITRTPQWEQVTNQLTNQTRSRRWRGSRASIDTGELRISVPNNLHQVSLFKSILLRTVVANRCLQTSGEVPSKLGVFGMGCAAGTLEPVAYWI